MGVFRKSDRDAVIVLLLIIIACFVLFPYVNNWIGWKKAPTSEKTENTSAAEKQKNDGEGYYHVEEKVPELFYFDPNTADSTQLLRLGLRPWQVRNIYKYRAAGGRYRKATDFARLYGLTLKQYKRLEPYIRIVPEVMAADVYGKDTTSVKAAAKATAATTATDGSAVKSQQVSAYPKKITAGEKIDINTADTSMLRSIPGIGPYFARQIVYTRQKLGGYASVSQLRDIEGFPEQSIAYTYVGTPLKVTKLNINQLDAWKLSRHPYILYVQAKEIVAYRNEHGKITSAEELAQLKTFSPSAVKKILPYIDF